MSAKPAQQRPDAYAYNVPAFAGGFSDSAVIVPIDLHLLPRAFTTGFSIPAASLDAMTESSRPTRPPVFKLPLPFMTSNRDSFCKSKSSGEANPADAAEQQAKAAIALVPATKALGPTKISAKAATKSTGRKPGMSRQTNGEGAAQYGAAAANNPQSANNAPAAPAKDASDGNGDKPLHKPRVVWTDDLHQLFLKAIEDAGSLEAAVPTVILKLMNVEGLSRDNVASHLQKHRLGLKRGRGRKRAATGEAAAGSVAAVKRRAVAPAVPGAGGVVKLLAGTVKVLGAADATRPAPGPRSEDPVDIDHASAAQRHRVHNVAKIDQAGSNCEEISDDGGAGDEGSNRAVMTNLEDRHGSNGDREGSTGRKESTDGPGSDDGVGAGSDNRNSARATSAGDNRCSDAAGSPRQHHRSAACSGAPDGLAADVGTANSPNHSGCTGVHDCDKRGCGDGVPPSNADLGSAVRVSAAGSGVAPPLAGV